MQVLNTRRKETPEGSALLPKDRNIILERSREIVVGDMEETVEDSDTTSVKMLADKDCGYALDNAS